MINRIYSFMSEQGMAQRIACAVGTLVILTGVLHLLCFPMSINAVWSGPTGARKLVVFGISTGLTIITMGWILKFMKPKPVLYSVMMLIISTVLLIEIFIINIQYFRGVPSHFNVSTPFDIVMWSAMMVCIFIFMAVALLQTVLTFTSSNASPIMTIAIRASMLLFMFSQVSGLMIVSNGESIVFQNGQFIIENIAMATTVGAAGDLKLPHALSLHAIQLIPLMALLLASLEGSEKNSIRLLYVGVFGFSGLVLISFTQALSGKQFLNLDTVSALLLMLSVVAFLLPYFYSITKGSFRQTGSYLIKAV